jgi:hypothetical protein
MLRRDNRLGALGMFFIGPMISFAGTVTFNDLTDTMTVTVSDPGRIYMSCLGLESCFVIVSAPDQARFVSTTLPGLPFFISEPQGILVSDVLTAGVLPPVLDLPPGYPVIFASYADTSTLQCSPFPTGCGLTEDGTFQAIGTITWSDNTVDTIRFQSDVETPEPSSTLLLVTGLVLLGARRGVRSLTTSH